IHSHLLTTSLIESPVRFEIASQLLLRQAGAHHFDWDSVLFKDRVVEGAVGYLARFDEFLMKGPVLQAAEHVRRLIKRAVGPIEGSPHFGSGIIKLMSNAFHQIIDTFFRRHLSQMKAQ